MHSFLLSFDWHDLLNPEFYIQYGGLWLLVFVIFAETGLFAGFFLPGDSLLFVAGIYSKALADEIFVSGNEYVDLLILFNVFHCYSRYYKSLNPINLVINDKI